VAEVVTADAGHVVGPGSSTPGQDQARRTITRTTITPAPGTIVPPEVQPAKATVRERINAKRQHGDLMAALEPYPGTSILRLVMSLMLSAMCLLTFGGAVLMLLLWQQNKDSGVLTTQIDRTWEIFDYLREIERWIAFGVVPVVVAWIILATINVRRATGLRRNPIVAAASFLIGVGGVWFIGSTQVADADGPITRAVGIAIQAAFLAIPLIVMERVAEAAEARHRPLRATYVIAVAYLAHLQGLGSLSTIDETSDPEKWGRLGAYLLIGGLIQVLGTLSANEAARAIEEGTDHRYQLRHRFGEALLAQAQRTR
jgi:hypothetical protein